MNLFQVSPNISGLQWTILNPKGIVIIAHGMAEHASRYNDVAQELNHQGWSVYAIDHLGHGAQIQGELKGHWPVGGFQACVDNLHTLITEVSANSLCPVFLLGHSMGSFIAQEYITQYGSTIAGCILSGTNGPSSLVKMGNFIANQGFAFAKKDKPNAFLNRLSFGSYNKPFAPNRTEFDWLSRDMKQVDAYVADPLCGYVCTTGFFQEFLSGMSHLWKKEKMKRIPTNLPIYLFSGSLDPVGNQGKGVKLLAQIYQDLGIKDVSMKLYPQGRHEMLNEINRDEVISDVYTWLQNHLTK